MALYQSQWNNQKGRTGLTRVPNSNKTLAHEALMWIDREIRHAMNNLSKSESLINELNSSGASFDPANITTLKNELINKAKEHNTNAVKMYRWMFDKLSITIPSAYTNDEVDVLGPDIRTHEEP